MGLPASSGRRHRTEAQPWRVLQLVQSAASASGARLANTGRGVPRPIDGGVGTGRLTPCRGGAVNLWTVGCADPRLTAPARSPMDKPGKTLCVSPTLPTGRGCPQASQHPATRQMNLISGKGETSSRLPTLACSSPEAVQTTGTVAVLAAVKYTHSRVLCRRAERGPRPVRQARHLQYRSGGSNSPVTSLPRS